MTQQKFTYFSNLQQMDVYLNKFERGIISNKTLLPFILDRWLVGLDFFIAIMWFIEILNLRIYWIVSMFWRFVTLDGQFILHYIRGKLFVEL